MMSLVRIVLVLAGIASTAVSAHLLPVANQGATQFGPEREATATGDSGWMTLPRECTSDVSEDTGKPVIFRSVGGRSWGLSTKTTSFGQPIPVVLWVCNTTDSPQSVLTCRDIDRFWVEGIDVFDTSGQRMKSILEEISEAKRRDSKTWNLGDDCLLICNRNFAIYIPPHAAIHGNFSKLEYDFTRDLRTYYALPPGQYVIVPSKRDPYCEPTSRTLANPTNGLSAMIEEQRPKNE